ncbi:MAG: hypothetical protein KF800_14400 [Lysobacter sp.]|nr:hypothetical protein [Lysobacter sp.]
MIVKSLSAALTAGLLSTLALTAPVTAHAGNVANATLGCFVDTYAYDYLTDGGCQGWWTPWGATNPSVVYLEVGNLPAGTYSFSWRDTNTGQTVCQGSGASCVRDISLYATVRTTVYVQDVQTGATKQLSADATYYNGYH